MAEHQGNKISVIDKQGYSFGSIDSLNIVADPGAYYVSGKGNTKENSNITVVLRGLHLDYGKYSGIDIIRIKDTVGKYIDYQVVGEKIKGNELTLPVLLCNY